MPKVTLANMSQVQQLVETLKNLRSERIAVAEMRDDHLAVRIIDPITSEDVDTHIAKSTLVKAIDTEIASVVKELKKLRINPDA